MKNIHNLEPKIDTIASPEHQREVGGRMFDVIVLPPEDPDTVRERDGVSSDHIHVRGMSSADQGSGRRTPMRNRHIISSM